MSETLILPCGVGEVSDGYHTFNELYEHRFSLWAAFAQLRPQWFWRSRKHHDGSMYPGWFIVGAKIPFGVGDVSYHLPEREWEMFDGIETLDTAPEWDGHTPSDVVERLKAFVEEYKKVNTLTSSPNCPDCGCPMVKSEIECDDGSGWYVAWLCQCKAETAP